MKRNKLNILKKLLISEKQAERLRILHPKNIRNSAPKNVLDKGLMYVVIKDLENIMFWASYGIGKAYGGSKVNETIDAIRSYSEYLGYSETENIQLGRYLPPRRAAKRKK